MVDETRAAATLLARKRKVYAGTCERCGAPFSGVERKRYCSKKCGVASWQKAARRARRAGTQAPPMGETGRDINSADRSSAPGQGHSVSLEGHLVSPGGLLRLERAAGHVPVILSSYKSDYI